jgi:hypothetical protein
MSVANFLAWAIGFTIFLALLHLAMSRGKFEPKGFFFVVGYGLLVGLPINFAVLLPGYISHGLYALIITPLFLPFLIMETLAIVKGRGPRSRSVCGIIGLTILVLVPFFPLEAILAPIMLGLLGIGSYIAFHFRYPLLNPMWLSALVADAAKEAPLGCGYSPKPITVTIPSRISFLSSCFGCSVYVRKDRTTVWMKEGLHARLGKPNLEILAQRIAERIQCGDGRRR